MFLSGSAQKPGRRPKQKHLYCQMHQGRGGGHRLSKHLLGRTGWLDLIYSHCRERTTIKQLFKWKRSVLFISVFLDLFPLHQPPQLFHCFHLGLGFGIANICQLLVNSRGVGLAWTLPGYCSCSLMLRFYFSFFFKNCALWKTFAPQQCVVCAWSSKQLLSPSSDSR